MFGERKEMRTGTVGFASVTAAFAAYGEVLRRVLTAAMRKVIVCLRTLSDSLFVRESNSASSLRQDPRRAWSPNGLLATPLL